MRIYTCAFIHDLNPAGEEDSSARSTVCNFEIFGFVSFLLLLFKRVDASFLERQGFAIPFASSFDGRVA